MIIFLISQRDVKKKEVMIITFHKPNESATCLSLLFTLNSVQNMAYLLLSPSKEEGKEVGLFGLFTGASGRSAAIKMQKVKSQKSSQEEEEEVGERKPAKCSVCYS